VVDQGPARFIAIDSNLLRGDYGGFDFDSEVAFVRSAAEGCAGRRCFVLAHHPPVTAGGHAKDATPEYLARLASIEAAAGGRISAWLAGHDHDLQHLRTPAGYDVLVSGNTSRGRPQERFEKLPVAGSQLLFASTAWGYGRLEVAPEGWTYRFEDERGEPLHCCAAVGAGPCQPVACR
jgi:tartrate-resistant acid phosphatase type 5